MISIITYNLLSPQLCYPEEFPSYDPTYLDKDVRKNKIVLLIDDWISREEKPIIAFQEVSHSWKGSLEKIFLQRQYYFITMNYGHPKNGFLGIGIAFPHSYNLEKIEYLPVGESVATPSPEEIFKKTTALSPITTALSPIPSPSSLIQKVISLVDGENPLQTITETIDSAKNRSNLAIRLTLKKNDLRFVVYNYHMPCTFRNPIIQTLHLDALKKLMSQHPKTPTILATDLNLTPDSTGYQYFTQNILDPNHQIYLKKSRTLTMRSCYAMANSQEPPFTCYSETKWGGLFKNTLDYIFVSEHFQVVSSSLLLTSDEKMPNKLSPSDHLPLQGVVVSHK